MGGIPVLAPSAPARSDAGGPSARGRVWRSLQRQPLFWVGAAFLAFLLLFSFLGPVLWHAGSAVNVSAILEPPSARHPLGTDALGRDYLWALMVGGALPIVSGFATSVVATALGVAAGLAAAFVRPLESTVLRIADAVLSVPPLVPILIAEGFFGVSIGTLMAMVVVTTWPSTARLVWSRGIVLREMPYIEAARATGASRLAIVRRHALPNALDTVIACFATEFATAVLFIALATMFGAGLGASTNWATMIATSGEYAFNAYWWLVLPPGIGFGILVLSVFFLAEAVRQAMHPQRRGKEGTA